MAQLVDIVDYVNLALFTALALAAAWLWHSKRSRPALWAAGTFGTLALVVDASRLVDRLDGIAGGVATRTLIALLALFPYLLYRFGDEFEPADRRAKLVVDGVTAFVVTFTFAQPRIPDEGEAQPTLFRIYLVVFVAHWAVLSALAAFRLWRAGRGQPSVARIRVRLLAVASAGLTVALLASVRGDDRHSGDELAVALLVSASAVAFLVGLVPPPFLRALWRRPESDRAQMAIAGLLQSGSEAEIATGVLPAMAAIVGAEAISVLGPDGRPVAVHGDEAELRSPEAHEVTIPDGRVVARLSRYAPLFGDEELRILQTLATFTGVALDRARLVARERELLERADELKTQFIALAAHELRTPIAALSGFADTLEHRAATLPAEQRELLERTLYEQIRRTARLVEQLLDLSRLDAEAVKLDPQPLDVRAKVEELVRAAAGTRVGEVEVAIPAGLVAELDADALERVLGNLVANALRYGAPPIRVTAARHDRHLRLAVEDSGDGIPADFVPYLFERFTRSAGSAELAGGSGLGLAIARSYAHAQGGDLFYERRTRGARFELVVPVA